MTLECSVVIFQAIEHLWLLTSHSAYAATETESVIDKIDGLLPPNFL